MKIFMLSILSFSVLAILALLPINAEAYVGPGLGAGATGVVIGVLTSIFLALTAIIWYPIKRILKKKREGKGVSATESTEPVQE